MVDEMIEEFEEGLLLRIYLDENDKIGGQTGYHWLVEQAMEKGLRGATVLRGMEGFGTRHKLHTAGILTLSTNLPVVIEIIDSGTRIKEFVSYINEHLNDGLVSLERVRFQHLGKSDAQ